MCVGLSLPMSCPTRFVVDATENSKGDVAAEVCNSQTGYEKIKRPHIFALAWVIKMKSLS